MIYKKLNSIYLYRGLRIKENVIFYSGAVLLTFFFLPPYYLHLNICVCV